MVQRDSGQKDTSLLTGYTNYDILFLTVSHAQINAVPHGVKNAGRRSPHALGSLYKDKP
jgi:hypothetical protein